MAKKLVTMKLNGRSVEKAVEPRTLLIHFLREECQLTACTVDIDGKSVKSCTHLAIQCEGSEILTVEGLAALAQEGSVLHAVQEGFYKEHGLQCGFCTPGMLTRAYRLLQDNPDPSEEEIRAGLSGNLCRCTGYQNIVKAVQYAAKKLREPVAA